MTPQLADAYIITGSQFHTLSLLLNETGLNGITTWFKPVQLTSESGPGEIKPGAAISTFPAPAENQGGKDEL